MIEQVQDSSQPRSDALIGGERPRAIDDVQDDVGVCAWLQAIPSLELRKAAGRDVCLKNAWCHDLEVVLRCRTNPAANHVRLSLKAQKIGGVSAQLEPPSSANQGRENVLQIMLPQ